MVFSLAVKKILLNAKRRDIHGSAPSRKLRKGGEVPGVIYGHDFEPLHVSVSEKEIGTALSGEAGRNVLIEMKVVKDGGTEDVAVMVKDLQKNALSSRIVHVDFLHIVLQEKIRTKVPIVLVGEPIGVKEDGGVMIHGLREIEVECLPTDIPNQFTVPVSEFRIGGSVHVSELAAPDGVTIISHGEETIVSVAAPAKEEVVEAVAVPADQVPATAQAAPVEGEAPAKAGPAAEGEKAAEKEKPKAEKPAKPEKEKK